MNGEIKKKLCSPETLSCGCACGGELGLTHVTPGGHRHSPGFKVRAFGGEGCPGGGRGLRGQPGGGGSADRGCGCCQARRNGAGSGQGGDKELAK